MYDYSARDDSIAPPKVCPFCSSPNVKTTSKTVTVSTYWRCTACGQIWNAGRLQRGSRAAGSFR